MLTPFSFQLYLHFCSMNKIPLLLLAFLIVVIAILYAWSNRISLDMFTFSNNINMFKRKNETYFDSKGKIVNERILIFRTSHGGRKYAPAHDSVHCFAKIAGHQLIDADLDQDQYAKTTCAEFKDKNFRRHCVLAEYLKARENVSYALALDGDVTVVNYLNNIEKFIDPNATVTFPVRFRTMEIAACSFIVKNDPDGRQFLWDWARYNRKLPNVSFHNSDNGALLAFVMEQRSLASHEYSICMNIWQKSNTMSDYMKFSHCVSIFLGASRKQREKIKILRRGHSWIRDASTGDGYWCDHDFFFHYVKAENYNPDPNDRTNSYAKPINVNECKYGGGASSFEMKSQLNISCDDLRKKLAAYPSDLPAPHLNTGSDLECWPHCDEDN